MTNVIIRAWLSTGTVRVRYSCTCRLLFFLVHVHVSAMIQISTYYTCTYINSKKSGEYNNQKIINKCTNVPIPRLLCFLDRNCHENPETQPVKPLELKHRSPPRTMYHPIGHN